MKPNKSFSLRVDRRQFSQTLLASGFTAAANTKTFAAATERKFDLLMDRKEMLPLFRKLKYAGDDRLVLWWLEVKTYGSVESVLTELFHQHIVSFHKARSLGGDQFEATSLEIIFHADPKSYEPVDILENPLTGRQVRLPQRVVGPTNLSYLNDKTILPETLPGVVFKGGSKIGPARQASKQIWLDEVFTTSVIFDSQDRPDYYVNDLSTYRAASAALEDDTQPFIPVSVEFNSVTSWPAWLEMDNIRGSKISKGYGHNTESFDEFPSATVSLLDQHFPDLLKEPESALTRTAELFE